MNRKPLGRGLDALIPESTKTQPEAGAERVAQTSLATIVPNRYQPRQDFDDEGIKELSESIKTQGVLQPLLVRPRAGGGYELIAGERRLRAAKLAGLEQVPIVVREVDDRTALELALVENLQREDLDPLEEGEAFRRLMTEFSYTQEQLSRRVGKERSTISNTLRLLNLPEEFKRDIKEGRLTAGHARAIMMAGSETLMKAIRDAVVNDGISVREAERRAQSAPRKTGAGKPKGKPESDVHIKDLEQKLVRALGTKVKILTSGKGGRIEIAFFSNEELDRILRRVLG